MCSGELDLSVQILTPVSCRRAIWEIPVACEPLRRDFRRLRFPPRLRGLQCALNYSTSFIDESSYFQAFVEMGCSIERLPLLVFWLSMLLEFTACEEVAVRSCRKPSDCEPGYCCRIGEFDLNFMPRRTRCVLRDQKFIVSISNSGFCTAPSLSFGWFRLLGNDLRNFLSYGDDLQNISAALGGIFGARDR